MYRFVRGNVEVAGRLLLTFPVLEGSHFALGLGVPVRIHAGQLAFDTGVGLSLVFADDLATGLAIPAVLTASITPNFFVQGVSAISMGFGGPDVVTFIPLGARVGYSIDAKNPIVDLYAQFQWTSFFVITPDVDANLEIFQVILGADVFLGT